ncbi:hypothetical protein [Pelomonas sp. SE-A7]|uniref:hypothetical protein n=1 Tax=Pelomonas sp. SE-A7 TaxID=3054953 RepID=UPI00259CB45F|nr:hypothetical protein [Pelomonas sp. SE-A7]MDM4766878.1 hypothetical protein [Pelomonas sp. SE-A7]
MSKFVVAAIACICGSTAVAGALTLPTTPTRFAIESLIGTTDVTLPTVRYQMGVARTTAQDFTVIVKPTTGATFTTTSCTAALPTITLGGAATGAFTPTIKRSSATECAYEIDVTTAFSSPAGADVVSLNFPGLVLDTHTLNIEGNTAGVTIGLWDLGETARIDNSSDASASVAVSGMALTLTFTADNATIIDVNNANGPLFGFVAGGAAPADTASVAAAKFTVNNNTGGLPYKKPDGTTNWEFTVDGTAINVTLEGNLLQLHATAPVAVIPAVGAAPEVTITAIAGLPWYASFALLPSNFNAANTAQDVTVTMTAAGNASMGTGRSFLMTAIGDVITGADENLLQNRNRGWWFWNSNGMQLMSPYFSTDPSAGVVSRFFLQNLGPATTYSTLCQADPGEVPTGSFAFAGTLPQGLLVLDPRDICVFPNGVRGSVTFYFRAAAANIKGVYGLSLNGGTTSFLPMQRPNGNNNTSNGSSF